MTRLTQRALFSLCLLSLVAVAGVAHASTPHTVAISYFDNNSADPAHAPLAKGLADMLITDLGQVSSLQIVERQRLEEVLSELKLGASKFIDPATAQKLGKGLAAQFIMTGGYLVLGDTLRIDARLVKVATAEVVATSKVEGTKGDFFAMEKELVDLLVGALEVKLPFAEKSKLRKNQTESFDAWWQYSIGLDLRDRGDNDAARKAFRAALEADPNYAQAKNATERLKAIFSADDKKKAEARAKLFLSLDPKQPEFGAKVDALLASYDREDANQVAEKIWLLTFMAERDLAPVPASGFSRIPSEILGIASIYLNDPDMARTIPEVCEYVITRWPKDLMAKPQCKTYLKVLGIYAPMDIDQRRKSWADGEKGLSMTWDLARAKNDRIIRDLLDLYASKVRK